MKRVCSVLYYTAAIALFGMADFSPLGLAAAQPQGSGSPCSGTPCYIPNLFDPDLADLKSANNVALNDFIKGALDRIKGGNNDQDRGCYPLPITVTVFTKPYPDDPKLTDFASDERMAAIWNYFSEKGLDPQKNVEPVKALGPDDGRVEGTYNDVDRDPPVLRVTWVPPSGTKVKKGQTIVAKISASERHADGHPSQPSGVQMIQLTSDNDGLIDSKQFGRRPDPCARQTVEMKYPVPKKGNLPPVIKLHAYADDAAAPAHQSVTDAEFPTQDHWSGTWKAEYRFHTVDPNFDWAITDIREQFDVDLDFFVDDDGVITGSGKARLARKFTRDECQGMRRTTCITQCHYDYDFNSSGPVSLDIRGHRDAAISALVLELQPSKTTPPQTTRAVHHCVGEQPPADIPIQFDWFNCPARPSADRLCAVNARFMRVSIDERSGAVASLPQDQQAPGYHGKVTIEKKSTP